MRTLTAAVLVLAGCAAPPLPSPVPIQDRVLGGWRGTRTGADGVSAPVWLLAYRSVAANVEDIYVHHPDRLYIGRCVVVGGGELPLRLTYATMQANPDGMGMSPVREPVVYAGAVADAGLEFGRRSDGGDEFSLTYCWRDDGTWVRTQRRKPVGADWQVVWTDELRPVR